MLVFLGGWSDDLIAVVKSSCYFDKNAVKFWEFLLNNEDQALTSELCRRRYLANNPISSNPGLELKDVISVRSLVYRKIYSNKQFS